MKTCSLSEAKSALGRLADEALAGKPTVITRGGRLLILQAYEVPEPDGFDQWIDAGANSKHVEVNDAFWSDVQERGKKLARKQRAK